MACFFCISDEKALPVFKFLEEIPTESDKKLVETLSFLCRELNIQDYFANRRPTLHFCESCQIIFRQIQELHAEFKTIVAKVLLQIQESQDKCKQNQDSTAAIAPNFGVDSILCRRFREDAYSRSKSLPMSIIGCKKPVENILKKDSIPTPTPTTRNKRKTGNIVTAPSPNSVPLASTVPTGNRSIATTCPLNSTPKTPLTVTSTVPKVPTGNRNIVIVTTRSQNNIPKTPVILTPTIPTANRNAVLTRPPVPSNSIPVTQLTLTPSIPTGNKNIVIVTTRPPPSSVPMTPLTSTIPIIPTGNTENVGKNVPAPTTSNSTNSTSITAKPTPNILTGRCPKTPLTLTSTISTGNNFGDKATVNVRKCVPTPTTSHSTNSTYLTSTTSNPTPNILTGSRKRKNPHLLAGSQEPTITWGHDKTPKNPNHSILPIPPPVIKYTDDNTKFIQISRTTSIPSSSVNNQQQNATARVQTTVEHLPSCSKIVRTATSWVYPESSSNYNRILATDTTMFSSNLKEVSYSCLQCHRVFNKKAGAIRHEQVHNKMKTFACEYCTRKFKHLTGLESHLVNSHEHKEDVKSYHCEQDECGGREFASKILFERHQRYHDNGDFGRYKFCKICDSKHDSASKLEEHLLQHQLSGNVLPTPSKKYQKQFYCNVPSCKKLGVFFIKKNLLMRHTRIEHPKLLTHCCSICDKQYSEENYLQTHMNTHYPPSNGIFNCNVCRSSFRHLHKLEDHLALHNGEDRFECSVCRDKFVTEPELERHKVMVHKINALECELCGKKCNFAQDLASHMACKHTTAETKTFVCGICDKELYTKHGIDKHMREIHLNIRAKSTQQKKCKICGVKVSSLKDHLKRIHGTMADRKKSCYFCQKKFYSHNELASHTYVHTGEKPYICKICGKEYSQNHVLVSHMKAHHKKEYLQQQKNKTPNNNNTPTTTKASPSTSTAVSTRRSTRSNKSTADNPDNEVIVKQEDASLNFDFEDVEHFGSEQKVFEETE